MITPGASATAASPLESPVTSADGWVMASMPARSRTSTAREQPLDADPGHEQDEVQANGYETDERSKSESRGTRSSHTAGDLRPY